MSASAKATWRGAALLGLPLVLLALLAEFILPAQSGRLVTLFMIYAIAVVGSGIYSGNTGVMSFGHVSFVALGAYASALLTINPAMIATSLPKLPGWLAPLAGGQPLYIALAGALLIVLVAALLSGLPLARLSGSAASIATLGFLMVTHVVLIASTDITRGSQTFFGIPRGVSTLMVLPAVLAAVIIARLYRGSRAGLATRAMREDEIAAVAVGIHPARRRYGAWVLSAVISGAAGVFLAHFLGAFSPKDFYLNLTFMLLSMLILGGIGTVSGALIGTAVIVGMVEMLRRLEGGIKLGGIELPAVFGLTDIGVGLAILLVLYKARDGLTGVREPDERFLPPALPAEDAEISLAAPQAAEGSLEVRNVSRHFAGLIALQDVSFTLQPGLVTGLIGPNGAGKSTMINAISGVVPPSSGTVLLAGRDTARVAPHAVASLGLGRTFQNIRLFKNLTVLENVRVAAEAVVVKGEDPGAIAVQALRDTGLIEMHHHLAGALPYGAQRRLEIARALALRPRFLLLDEPAAGMNPVETEALIATLRQIRERYGMGLLVVEHDMKLIMRLCDRIVVLDKGRKIAEGTPDEVRHDPVVIEAYIGRPVKQETAA